MYVYYVLILLMIKNVFGDDERYERYIDLLPEKEKQEFLDRIARRIMEGIKTDKLNDPNQPNLEITDAQLEAQDAYVQDILKEETERLEDEKRKDDSLKTEEGEDNGDDNKYIDLTLREGKSAERGGETETTTEFPYNVIPVKTIYDDPNDDPNGTVNKELKENLSTRIKHEIKDSSNIDESYNDPTLQLDKDDLPPQISNDTKNENLRKFFHKDVSNVSILTDYDQNFDNGSLLKEDYDINSETALQISDENRNNVTNDKVILITNLTSNEMKDLNKDVNTERQNIETTYKIQNFDKSSLVTEDDDVNNKTNTQNFDENLNNVTGDKVIEVTNLSSNEKDLNKEVDIDIQNTETTTRESNIATAISTVKSRSSSKEDAYETTMFTMKANEATENNLPKVNHQFQRSGIDEIISSDTQTDINKISIESAVKLTNVIGNSKINESEAAKDYTEITENKIESKITNSSSNLTLTREDVKNTTHNNEANTSEDKLIEPKTVLNLGSNLKESKEDIIWTKKLDTKPEKAKTYEVFEVAAEKPPFRLLNKSKTEMQPHYVPIYDYAPENAYFRPYDRFGPDFRDVGQEILQNNDLGDEHRLKSEYQSDFIIPSTRSRFSSYNNKGDRQYRMKDVNYPIKKGNSEMYGFMKPVQAHFINNKYYNPYDYFDLDYTNSRYILRSANEPNLKPFPDSNEHDHPYNSIHKSDSVKDHIRAVRKLLYLQKRFGYVPEADKEIRKFVRNAKNIKIATKKTKAGIIKEPINDKISVDYYYDRADSRQDSESVQAVRRNSSQGEILVVPAKELIGEFNAVLNMNNKRNSIGFNNIDRQKVEKRKFHSFFDTMLDVLADMIRFDNEALEGYDWLRTSVDIQSGVRKLLDLTANLKNGKEIHPKDLELLKYCLYLFKSSHVSLHNYGRENKIDIHVKKRKKKGLLPKNRKKDRNKQPLLLWKDLAKFIRNHVDNEQKLKILYDFEDFLQLILYRLNDFHDAIKHIAMITKYDNQRWFLDLKQIYFKEASRKHLGIVILHLSVLTLLDHIEVDAVIISEVNFRLFVEKNPKVVKSTRKEFVFVFRVLEELNRINV